MCSLTTECVLLLQNVFSYYRMCSLTTQVKRAAAEGLRIVDLASSSSCAQGLSLQLGNEVCEPPSSALGAPAQASRAQGPGMPHGLASGRGVAQPADTRPNAGESGPRDGGERESKGDTGAWTGMTDEQRLAALSETRMALRQRAGHGKA